MPEPVLNQVRRPAMSLTPEKLLKLIADLASQIQVPSRTPQRKSFPSTRGALADLGPAPSADEIDEARREAWAGTPRDES